MKSRHALGPIVALALIATATPALAVDITCFGVSTPPQLISAEVAGPRTLNAGDNAPEGWNPLEGRLTRGGIHYLSTRWVEVRMVTDRCSQVVWVRVGARAVTTTFTDGYEYFVTHAQVAGNPQRISHTLVVYFPNTEDGSTETVTVAIGRQVARSSPVVEYSFPIVRVRSVDEHSTRGSITFSQAELYNTFSSALYETFNREQNSTVIIKEDGSQVRVYGYEPTQTSLSISSLGISFSFRFRIDKTCNPRAQVQGRFRFSADGGGINLVWLVPPYTILNYDDWCEVAGGIPGIGQLIGLLFSGGEGEVSAGVRGRIEEAVRGALPDTTSFAPFLDGSSTRAGEMLVHLTLPVPSVEIALPYDAFNTARTATALPPAHWIALLATGLANPDHVAGEAPTVTLRSGPNGVPLFGTTDWPNARTVERSGPLVWNSVPVSRLLAYRVSPEHSMMRQYTPGCSISTDSLSGGPVSIRLGANDTAADAERLQWSKYLVRLYFFPYEAGGGCRVRLSDLATQAPPPNGGR